MSNLPMFLQHMNCFDGRPSPSIPQDYLKYYYEKYKPKKPNRICPVCGKQFVPPQERSKYCGEKCRTVMLGRRQKTERRAKKQAQIEAELKGGDLSDWL